MAALRTLFDRALAGRRLPAIVIIAASAGALGGAFLFQYVGGLAPCVLCVYQRYPYGVALALAAAAVLLVEPRPRGTLLALSALAFVVDAGIGVFHVGVEQHWWEGTAACSGSLSSGTAPSLEALRQQILAAPVVRCDRVPWSLFGVSLAGYNVLIAAALALFASVAARRALGSEGR